MGPLGAVYEAVVDGTVPCVYTNAGQRDLVPGDKLRQPWTDRLRRRVAVELPEVALYFGCLDYVSCLCSSHCSVTNTHRFD